MTAFIKTYWLEIAVVTLALAARLIFFGIVLHQSGDIQNAVSGPDGYTVVSQNLIEGHGLSSDTAPPYTPYSFRPPLYHFFIAGSYMVLGGYWGVVLLQILLGSLVPILGMMVASYITGRRVLLGAVGVFLALEPSGILYSTFFYSETLFMVLFLAALWALFGYLKNSDMRLLAASAALMGLATLTRPTTEFLPLVFLGVLLWQHRGRFSQKTFEHIGIYAIIFLTVLAPWVMRNYVVFGVAGISPQTGVNLYTTLLPTVLSIDNGTTFQQEFAAQRVAGIHGPNDAAITEGGQDMKLAIPLLLHHPRGLAYSTLNSTWSFFVLDGMYDFFRRVDLHPREVIGKPSAVALFTNPGAVVDYLWRNLNSIVTWILLARVVWIAVTIAFVYGAWRTTRSAASVHAALALLVVVYFLLTSLITGFGLTARYRLPVNALVITFAACGVAPLVQKLRRSLP